MLLCSCDSPSCDPLCDTMLEMLVLQPERKGMKMHGNKEHPMKRV